MYPIRSVLAIAALACTAALQCAEPANRPLTFTYLGILGILTS